MKYLVLSISVLLCFFSQAWGNELEPFQRGVNNYQFGHYEAALRDWLPFAEQGNATAQTLLGSMHRRGKGVSVDHIEALRWFRLAAEQGHPGAQYGLAIMYEQGEGVPTNFVKSYKWANLATANGHSKAAKLRDFIAEMMAPSEIEEAQRLASECVKKNYKGCC